MQDAVPIIHTENIKHGNQLLLLSGRSYIQDKYYSRCVMERSTLGFGKITPSAKCYGLYCLTVSFTILRHDIPFVCCCIKYSLTQLCLLNILWIYSFKLHVSAFRAIFKLNIAGCIYLNAVNEISSVTALQYVDQFKFSLKMALKIA
jgi:hypothetical protein